MNTPGYSDGYKDRSGGALPSYVRTAQGHMLVCYGSELDFIDPDPGALDYAAAYVRGWEAAEIAAQVAP